MDNSQESGSTEYHSVRFHPGNLSYLVLQYRSLWGTRYHGLGWEIAPVLEAQGVTHERPGCPPVLTVGILCRDWPDLISWFERMSWYLNELKGERRGRQDPGRGPIGVSIRAAPLPTIQANPTCPGEVLENTQKGWGGRGIPRTEGHFTTKSLQGVFQVSLSGSVWVPGKPCLSGELVNPLGKQYVVLMGRKSVP